MRHRLGLGIVALVVGVLVLAGAGIAVAQDQSPPHENPDEVEDDSDLAELERWFGSRMGEMHVDCTEGLAVGNFDACEDLDEEYESYLERYVTVERETTSNESERDGEQFNETRNEQQELGERLREFNETRQEYEEARENGNESGTRTKARQLRRQAERIDELGGNVSRGFRELDDDSSANLTMAAIQINETTDEVNTYAGQAEEESLEPVEIAAQSDGEASFASPATVSGVVRKPDWTAVPSGRVVVSDDAGGRATSPVDENGSWAASYRPVRTATGPTDLNVTYVPEETSPYLDANTTTTVTVVETATTIEVESATDQVSYGENVTAAGRLTAAGDGAENVSVALAVQNESIGTARTDSEGRFQVTGPLPAAVPVGEVDVNVTGGEAGTALAPATGSGPVMVNASETTLSATVEYDDEQAHVGGRLQTEDGDPVAGRPVTLTVGDNGRAVRTDSGGYYSFVVDRSDAQQTATVRYEERGGNLMGSNETVQIEPRSNESFSGVGEIGESLPAPGVFAFVRSLINTYPYLSAFLGVVVLANLVIWSLVAIRRIRWWLTVPEETSATTFEGLEPAIRPVTDETGGLSAARSQLEQAPSTAVQLAFATVRSTLGVDDARTHWEVYQAASDGLDAERRDALRTVTEAFEAATFSPEGIDSDRASAALDDAERCLATSDGGE